MAEIERTQEADAPTAVTAPPKPAPAEPSTDRLPPFNVLLHNDDVNDMDDVVQAIVELTPLGARRATMAMLEAHVRGLSLLLTTHKERAELYQEQFASKSLTVTIEPAT